jgi:predicted dehydrogenase
VKKFTSQLDHMPAKFGVLGAANIARKNCRAIFLAPNCELVAVASRTLAKAEQFVAEHNFENVTAYGSYEELLDNNQINCIYIPLPTTEHIKWVSLAASRGKHVLCEKPVAKNSGELATILATCQENGVIFMDGVMFHHHNRMRELFRSLHDPFFVSEAVRVQSSFSFRGNEDFFSNNIRAKSTADPLGALGDLGWYNIRLALLAFSKYSPQDFGSAMSAKTTTGFYKNLQFPLTPPICHATASAWNSDNTVPFDCSGRVTFGRHIEGNIQREKCLVFESSFLLPLRQNYEIVSLASQTDGNICDRIYRCEDFVIPANPNEASFSLLHQPPVGSLSNRDTLQIGSRVEVRTDGAIEQEVSMMTEFARIVLEGDFENARIWSRLSMATQLITDAAMISIMSNGEKVEVNKESWLSVALP